MFSKMFPFVNSPSGDKHNHGHLLHISTNAAFFLQITKQMKFVNRVTTVFDVAVL